MSEPEEKTAPTTNIDSRCPSVDMMHDRARRRMPRFAYEYLTGGCFTEINLKRNTKEIRDIQLMPWYLNDYKGSDLKTELFGKTYDAPFGVRRLDCKD